MDFAFTDEQIMLRETVAQFLSVRCPVLETRQLLESSTVYDRDVWIALGRDLGLGGIHAPIEHGGAGLSYVETCIVLEEMGRALYCGPYLSSNVLAVNALLCCETPESKTLLADIACCNKTGTVALLEPENRWDTHSFECLVADGVLSGKKTFVTDGVSADFLIVATSDDAEACCAFYVVDANAPGLKCTSLETLDRTRNLTQVSFENVQATKLANVDEASYQEFLDRAIVALANEMVGGAQRMLNSAVDYSSTRVQFGRTIGSLQAIKHKCAEMLLDVELAKSASYRAAEAISNNDDNCSAFASIAKAMASDVYTKAASECIQIHGGIGFTWENDTHLWYRRAKSSEVFLGDASYHREKYLQTLGV